VTYQDLHSTFDNSVRDAIRRGAAENEVPKHEERFTGAWRRMNTLRRRYEGWRKGDDIEDCTHQQRYGASCKIRLRSCIRTLGLVTENS